MINKGKVDEPEKSFLTLDSSVSCEIAVVLFFFTINPFNWVERNGDEAGLESLGL